MYELIKHQYSVAELSRNIGRYMKLTLNEIKLLELAAFFHDVGKLFIPKKLLSKKGFLSAEEFEIVKMHSVYGAELLKQYGFDNVIVSAVRHHHERYDGRGYPDGMRGEEIPLFSRIIAAADAFEVMTTGRVYKKSISKDKAIEELIRCSGTQFDPEVVKIFVKMFKEEEAYV
ncbi:diguanylate cyclase [Caldanaerobacter subterraneus subsp. yonseiensis KB-1]|uniref:Diguanylate cyclase n=1 Tax=Caldanaerobacter subterraneus subsp. yonseiensis KB-1 TaxID=1388761 RepID=U5CHR4_CALSX|nr:HD domain-containing phosphohydrolase [Caldanaerobacter subterraneus]ERM92465.1 diguanylate cyclase [Caldanaerobacter subterraneus subsp. yonseiensis KB-1]